MPATQVGTAHIHSLSGGALAIAALGGYIVPNLQTLKLSHAADVDRIKGMAGRTTGVIYDDDSLECTFEFIPEGTSIANAKISAGLPAAGSGVVITGLPVIAVGGFADALNATSWLYEGGGSINGNAAGKWTATLPLKRYIAITSTTAMV